MSVLRRTARALALTSRDAGVSGGRVRRLNLSAFDNDKVKKLTPEELARQAAEMEELSVFRAVGGLVAACAGGAAVFAVGAAATLGVSSLAASGDWAHGADKRKGTGAAGNIRGGVRHGDGMGFWCTAAAQRTSRGD